MIITTEYSKGLSTAKVIDDDGNEIPRLTSVQIDIKSGYPPTVILEQLSMNKNSFYLTKPNVLVKVNRDLLLQILDLLSQSNRHLMEISWNYEAKNLAQELANELNVPFPDKIL